MQAIYKNYQQINTTFEQAYKTYKLFRNWHQFCINNLINSQTDVAGNILHIDDEVYYGTGDKYDFLQKGVIVNHFIIDNGAKIVYILSDVFAIKMVNKQLKLVKKNCIKIN